MKLHPIFGINALARVCLCCGKVIGYTPIGDNVDEDLSNSKQIAGATVCKEYGRCLQVSVSCGCHSNRTRQAV